jgi:hypothetical protein
MKEEQMRQALDAIYDRAVALKKHLNTREERKIVDEIIALSRYKFDVIGKPAISDE